MLPGLRPFENKSAALIESAFTPLCPRSLFMIMTAWASEVRLGTWKRRKYSSLNLRI